jgi:hypothetical protein
MLYLSSIAPYVWGRPNLTEIAFRGNINYAKEKGNIEKKPPLDGQ